MVTPPRPYSDRLFLKENRIAKGVSAAEMARRLGIERESVYRLEREAMTRMDGQKQVEYATALGLRPEQLWAPPGKPSLDALVVGANANTRALAADIVKRLIDSERK